MFTKLTSLQTLWVHSLNYSVETLLTDTSITRTPLYYGQFVWSQKCQKSFIPYLYNTDSSVRRTIGSVPLLSVWMVFTVTSSNCKVKVAGFYEFLWYPILALNALIYIPNSSINCLKTVTHTYIAHIWQYPPSRVHNPFFFLKLWLNKSMRCFYW